MKAIGPKLVIATHNAGKLREIRELLAPHGIECVGAAELDLPEPEETGNTFIDNAELKAREAADLSGLPGIFSARWAEDEEGNRDFGRAMERVWKEIEAAGDEASHDAHFVCALAIAWPDNGQTESFEGKVFGTLSWPPRGDRGFGYDPIFVANGMDQTFAEIDPAEKHAISHRAEAFRQLVAALG